MLAGWSGGEGTAGCWFGRWGGGESFSSSVCSSFQHLRSGVVRWRAEGLVYRSSLLTFPLSSCPNNQLFGNTHKKKQTECLHHLILL